MTNTSCKSVLFSLYCSYNYAFCFLSLEATFAGFLLLISDRSVSVTETCFKIIRLFSLLLAKIQYSLWIILRTQAGNKWHHNQGRTRQAGTVCPLFTLEKVKGTDNFCYKSFLTKKLVKTLNFSLKFTVHGSQMRTVSFSGNHKLVNLGLDFVVSILTLYHTR